MSNQDQPPGPRLALAGVASVVLLLWLVCVPHTVPPLVAHPHYAPHPVGVLSTVVVSVCILVVLAPVVGRGSPGQRALALFLGLLPALVLVHVTLWALPRM